MNIKGKVRFFLLKFPRLFSCSIRIFYLFGDNRITQKGRNNHLYKNMSLVKHSKSRIIGSNNSIIYGNKSILDNCKIDIRGNNNEIEIGDNVLLKDVEFYIEGDNNKIHIGKDSKIFGKTHLACTEGKTIFIGDDCMFSSDVVFRTGDSHSIIDSLGKRINFAEDIVIGNHVWFGNRTIILKGVKIADNSIIGTGAVVTKKFDEKGNILAGNPARIIRQNMNWLREVI